VNYPFDSEPENQLGFFFVINSKLQKHCPLLFSSLSLWERDALEKSQWLHLSTSANSGPIFGGSGTKNSPLEVSAMTLCPTLLPAPDSEGTTNWFS
jgi:hypothetical protein